MCACGLLGPWPETCVVSGGEWTGGALEWMVYGECWDLHAGTVHEGTPGSSHVHHHLRQASQTNVEFPLGKKLVLSYNNTYTVYTANINSNCCIDLHIGTQICGSFINVEANH